MSTVYLAFYKGPATDFWHNLGHKLTCLFTNSKYSHCEIVINGTAMQSSSRDGGVRFKTIDMTNGKWDIVEVDCDAQYVFNYFQDRLGCKYDWAGIFRFVIPFIPHNKNQYVCSEICAGALGYENPEDYAPEDLAAIYL